MTPTFAKAAPAAHRLPLPVRIEFPRLISERSHAVKRAFDIGFVVLFGLLAAPFALLIALAIVLEAGGPVLFAHERIGRGRKFFRVWKFRSMLADADEVLERYLANNPAAALEWELTHKLKHDPRVTRVGRLLRRTSLDELPQLWNVLRGEMSIVGPRPIVEAEIPKHGSAFPLYAQVKPGLTGLWQVSGRNDTTYRRRVELDVEYIRRWSPVLDLRLVFKTARVVLAGKGAY